MKLILSTISLAFFAILPAFSQDSASTQAANKKLVLLIFEEGINNRNLSVFDNFFVVDVKDHSAFPGQADGLAGLKNSVKELHEAFPDVKVKVEDIIAEGDLVASRETWTTKSKASGKDMSGWVLHIFKVRNGKVTEEWSKGWEWMNAAE